MAHILYISEYISVKGIKCNHVGVQLGLTFHCFGLSWNHRTTKVYTDIFIYIFIFLLCYCLLRMYTVGLPSLAWMLINIKTLSKTHFCLGLFIQIFAWQQEYAESAEWIHLIRFFINTWCRWQQQNMRAGTCRLLDVLRWVVLDQLDWMSWCVRSAI